MSVPIKNYSFFGKQNINVDTKMAQMIKAKIEENSLSMFGVCKYEHSHAIQKQQTEQRGSPSKFKKQNVSRSPKNTDKKNDKLTKGSIFNGSETPEWCESIPKSLKPTVLALTKGSQSINQSQNSN